ncbi:calcium-binding EF hand family protein [Actinidia rufa]|uniref:Calcium-binding EF hand family protein n=1 Tax=Actinidia rufa TaxID=165716 RepID=A0A7J0ENH5_9ERIC|nr:calcium-binding EF hand family protein [Actinidia rufa]
MLLNLSQWHKVSENLPQTLLRRHIYGPASAKIPAPQINFAATAASPSNPTAGTAVPPVSGVAPASSQNIGVRGPQVLLQLLILWVQNISTDWLGGRTVVSAAGVTAQVPNMGITPSTTQDAFGMTAPGITTSAQPRPNETTGLLQPSAPKPNDPTFPSSHMGANYSKSLAISGNGFTSDSVFGDVFSVTKPQSKQDTPSAASSASNFLVASAMVPTSTGPQPTVKSKPTWIFTECICSTICGVGNAVTGLSQVLWPRMTQSDVQKYTKVFVEVDRDRDGKITGAEALNLFLSWRLPREVLKQVWDLSDQDNDSMLSLREFCIALYLMERYREGRPLPKTLPSSIMFDETMLPASGQPAAACATWGLPPGLQQARVMPGAQPARPPNQVSVPLAEEAMQPAQQKSKVPVLEKHIVNQLSEEEQNSLNSKFLEATEANKKVFPASPVHQ